MEISVDMIRLRTKVPKGSFQEFMNKYILKLDFEYTYYQSFRFNDYRYNFTFKSYSGSFGNPFVEDSSFYVGFGHNSEFNKFSDVLVVEFNPNKCYYFGGFLNDLLFSFFGSPRLVTVVSVDVAIDIFGVSMFNCIVDKFKKRRYLEYIENNSRTLYLGKKGKNCNGAVKIYDKAAEQKLNKLWTRFEVTLKLNLLYAQILSHLVDCEYELPTAYFIDDSLLDNIDVGMKCYIYSLLQGFVKMNDFTYYLKNKIRLCLDDIVLKKIDNGFKPLIADTIITFMEHYYKVISKKNVEKLEDDPPKIIVGDVGEKVKDYIQLKIE